MVDADAGKGQTGVAAVLDPAVGREREITLRVLRRVVGHQQPGAGGGQGGRQGRRGGRIPVAPDVALLSASNGNQPTVLVHRDYHSPNLMVCDQPQYGPNPGVIDFQDALAGPITYDLASLVTDARTTWEEPQQLDWAIRYWEMARAAGLPVDADFAEFHRAYEWMGLQRNLRILGVFARLNHRDGKAHYLAHMPRVNGYVRQVAQRYGVFTPLLRLLDQLDDRQVSVGYTF